MKRQKRTRAQKEAQGGKPALSGYAAKKAAQAKEQAAAGQSIAQVDSTDKAITRRFVTHAYPGVIYLDHVERLSVHFAEVSCHPDDYVFLALEYDKGWSISRHIGSYDLHKDWHGTVQRQDLPADTPVKLVLGSVASWSFAACKRTGKASRISAKPVVPGAKVLDENSLYPRSNIPAFLHEHGLDRL